MVGIRRRRILVVTPAFNAERFIDDAITSVVVQNAPGLSIHYHVQDGGSTDGTVDKLRLWEDRLKMGLFPGRDADFHFSFASEADRGMYDALQRGFDKLSPCDDDILTWINSDDGLSQGSLVAVSQVFEDVRGCEFLSGRIALLNEAGALIVLGQPLPYFRVDLAGGLHDGRTLSFLMQEGTFFSGRVWIAVGGVNPRFRLAGDWDLWRRIAGVADHFLVDSITGFHRRRRGQLSGDMVSYYREIDATPLPEPTSAPGAARRGTVVVFDQSAGRWAPRSYDNSMLAIPALLRDGRPVRSAACRPVAGFEAPEGPYPEYGLPAGIRWISGSRGEIDIVARRAGRYRVRLSVRAVRSGVVVGLKIDGREPLPISLEPPASFVNQVIETIWWLKAGANRLLIDCGAGSAQRALLLIECEASETDERMGRRAVLPPAERTPRDRSGLAIAILCHDDEPELLERSIAACEEMVRAGAGVFVFLQSAALHIVVDAQHDLITRRIELCRPPDRDMTPIRRTLHEAGFAHALIVQRGSLVLPRGVDAAIAALNDNGAGMVFGLVDERDSMGRPLQLVDAPNTAPVLFSNVITSAFAGPVAGFGCCLAQATSHARDFANTPIVWLIDEDRPVLGRTPAILLAAALALLGYDARHVVSSGGARFDPPSGAMVIASSGGAHAVGAQAIIALYGGSLRLVLDDGETVNLPLVVDTDLLLPRGRSDSRRRLGFDPDEYIVCMAETSEEDAAAIFARIEKMDAGSRVRVLNFGSRIATTPVDCNLVELGTLDDLLLVSYFLSAADAALTTLRRPSLLACAAWSCGLAVLDVDGMLFEPGTTGTPKTSPISAPWDDACDAERSKSTRNLVIGTRSIAALALAINERCALLRTPAGTSRPLSLRSGKVSVRSYRAVRRNEGPYRGSQPVVAIPLRGAIPFVAADVHGALSLIQRTAELIVCIEGATGSRLQVHVRGVPGDFWDICVGEGKVSLQIDADGAGTISIPGEFRTGPTHLAFVRVGDDNPPVPLHIVGLEVIGEPQTQTPAPRWEETMVELVPASEQAVTDLEMDGDWQRIAGFLDEEPPVPQQGLHAPFRWSLGDRCTVRMRVTHGGRRALRLAFSAGLRHQRIRPVVAGRAHNWSSPLTGPIGHVEYRQWVIDWLPGDIDVCFELSEVLRAPGADLGIILFALSIDDGAEPEQGSLADQSSGIDCEC